jgi:nucleoside-diphosphate-sugar epimerase
MVILVVGGAGYIGYEVCLYLKAQGHEVWALDPDAHRSTVLHAHKIRSLVDSVENVVVYPEAVKRFDAIINLTGGYNDHKYTWDPTISPTPQLMANIYLRQANKTCRIVHASTQHIYSTPDMNKERSKPSPETMYGIIQSMAETPIRDDDNAVILRLGTVWGKGTFVNWETWGNHLFSLKSSKDYIDIYYPYSMLCMLSMHNVKRALEWALKAQSGVYNVADKIGLRWDIAKEVLNGYPCTERKATGGFSIGMDCERIVKAGFVFEPYDLGFDDV